MASAPDLVLGVDSGGTKTLLALADRDGAVHLLQRGPSLDPFAERRWPEHLDEMIRSLAPSWHRLAGAALGLSCHGEVDVISRRQVDAVAALLPIPHLVLNDVRVAFDGALAGGAGVLLLAGTGSMAWAGDGRERDARIGGWGELYGDEGSAFWIGRKALSVATRALDRRGPDLDFAEALFQCLRLSPGELNSHFLGAENRRTTVARVAKHVDMLANQGEDVAENLMRGAGRHIADHVAAAQMRLDLPSDGAWSYAGGVFASRTVMAEVARTVGRPPRVPLLPPVGGALLRAARLVGWDPDERWIARLATALDQAHRHKEKEELP